MYNSNNDRFKKEDKTKHIVKVLTVGHARALPCKNKNEH